MSESVEARPASTVVLLRDTPTGLETLLLKRNKALLFAGGAWVFPGGALDAQDLAAARGDVHLAARIAARYGLINTMVFTHIPSNILLMMVPLMPTLPIAVLVMLVRFSISQMDVPTRQSYTMAVVDPDERSAAAGVTGIARSVGAAVSPSIAA